MALININLTEAEQKLVDALKEQILPEIVHEVTNQIIPALSQAVDGMHVDFHVSLDITKKNETPKLADNT